MATTAFSIGRDTQLVVIGSAGRIDLTYVSSFEARQITQSVRVDRLDGIPMGTELPKGWEGSFEIERGNSAADDFISLIEQNYFNGGGVATGTMYQYISEADGSTSTYEYDTVIFKLASAGQWRGDASVKQKLDFFASRRRRI
jgi:hypothetical protein